MTKCFAATVSLAALASGYLAIGFWTLMFDTSFSYPIDMRMLWIENRLFHQGLDPQEHGHPDPELPTMHRSVRNVGGGYPPWTYAIGVYLIPPFGWQAARYYFAAVNLLAIATIAYGAWSHVRDAGSTAAALGCLTILAMFPFAICLSYGQYSIVVTACLVACWLFLEKGYDQLAGISLGVALIKPHLAGLFAVALLVRGRWKPLLTAAAVVGLASARTWQVTGHDPLTMLVRASQEARFYVGLSHNPLILWSMEWVGYQRATLGMAAAGAALCVLASALAGCRMPLLAHFGVCAVISMYWSYRKSYDAVLLAFPMLALWVLSLRTPHVRWGLLLFGVSLWAPIKSGQQYHLLFQALNAIIWIGAAVLLVALAARGTPPPVTPDSQLRRA